MEQTETMSIWLQYCLKLKRLNKSIVLKMVDTTSANEGYQLGLVWSKYILTPSYC